MNETEWLAERFEQHRSQLRGVAYHMLGSLAEADDAVQEAWLRLARSEAREIENLRGWLTTVVARVCLNTLESRRSRREEPLDVHVPDPVVSLDEEIDPEDEALLADSVGLALLVVLDTLTPPERLAFVLHDMFAVPFDEIDAFVGAAREGDFNALLEVLDPDVVLRADAGAVPSPPSRLVRGAREVAGLALAFSDLARSSRPALVNGAAGIVVAPEGRVYSVFGVTIKHDKIVEFDILGDPERLAQLDLVVLDD